jgi:large repetitive protein
VPITIAVTVESTSTTTMGSEIDNTITGAPGNDLAEGFVGNDVISGNDGNDLLYGGAGNDTLNGGNGLDALHGGAGTDTLNGGTGTDKLYGGAGNDALTGGTDVDVFAWTLADRGAPGTPATDTITDFNLANPAAGGDLLDLRDLLQGEVKAGLNPGSLEQFLDFDTTSSAGNTIIRISSNGGFAGGTYSAGAEDQRIILQGVDLRSASAFGLTAAASDNDIIQQLLQRGKLVTDGT